MSEFDRRTFLVQSAGALTAVALTPLLVPAAIFRAQISVAIIGLGRQGRAIVTELQKMENIRIVAFCDTEQARVDWGTKRIPGSQGFTNHKELLDKVKDAQAVIIATPTHLHKGIAVDTLAAGKHVYCEMPMAHTIDDAKAMAAAARTSKSMFHAGMEGRSNPIYKLARTFFRSDSVRDVVAMRGQNFQKTSWRFPGNDAAREKALNWRLDTATTTGLPGELGTHQFDVYCWYRDSYPTTISGFGDIVLHKDGREVADTVMLRMTWPDGRHLSWEATLANSYQGKHEILHGTNAAVKLGWTHGWMFKESDAPTQGWEVYANRQQFHNDEGITLIADATKLASQGKLKDGVGLPNPSLYYSLYDFLKCVEDSKASPMSADVGYRATVLGILAHQAIVSGTTQKVPEDILK